MPISVAGNNPLRGAAAARLRPAGERGFTLVELLLVMTIIGLAAAAVALNLPDARTNLASDAARFAVRARAARDLAIIEARPVSIWVSPGGYGFEERAGGAWRAIADKPLRAAQWQAGTIAAISGSDGQARIVFDPTGMADRTLDVRLTRRGETREIWLGSGDGVRLGD